MNASLPETTFSEILGIFEGVAAALLRGRGFDCGGGRVIDPVMGRIRKVSWRGRRVEVSQKATKR